MRLLSFLLVLMSFSTTAQEPANYKPVTQVLLKAYNEGSYTQFTSLFNASMSAAVPPEEVAGILDGVKFAYGKMQALEFIKMGAQGAKYKMILERGEMLATLALDKQNRIAGLLFEPYVEQKQHAIIERNKTKLALPFNGEWLTFWGGDTPEQNYHVESASQKNAFDFVIADENCKSYKGDSKLNESYFAFGKEVLAPCDATVTDVVDGVRDNIPGEMNRMFVPGNMVIMKTDNGEYLFFAHFKKHTIKVKEGDKVKKGTVLGLCGNSGNSSEPHLHFHIMNIDNIAEATGTKAYFEKITVTNYKGTREATDYSPIKNDRVKN